jgi:hypothetical protein
MGIEPYSPTALAYVNWNAVAELLFEDTAAIRAIHGIEFYLPNVHG